MTIDRTERFIRYAAAIATIASYVTIFTGIARSFRRRKGRVTGFGTNAQRLVLGLPLLPIDAWVVVRLWRPVPVWLSPPVRWLALVLGAMLYVPGLVLPVWGRFALGEMYNVSSTLGVELYADHRLVQSGPFRFVRHPMYLGAYHTCVGALLIYRTWTMLFIIAHTPVLLLRARREEAALAQQFGAEWESYAARVPAWVPRLPRGRDARRPSSES